MKAYLVSLETDQQFKPSDTVAPGDPPPEGSRAMFLPRIRCNDCPGKVYTTVKETVVEDFEVHLKNRHHRGRVEDREKQREKERHRAGGT